ncbi:MAG TPA: hypothetical protein VGB77_12840 [Abditibacteriaceae bacterium]|jgi:hypothetical protein
MRDAAKIREALTNLIKEDSTSGNDTWFEGVTLHHTAGVEMVRTEGKVHLKPYEGQEQFVAEFPDGSRYSVTVEKIDP